MAVQVNTVTVGTTATELAGDASQRGSTITFTTDASVVMEVGGSAVTFGTGYPLKLATEYTFDRNDGSIFAVVSSGTVDIDVLTSGASKE